MSAMFFTSLPTAKTADRTAAADSRSSFTVLTLEHWYRKGVESSVYKFSNLKVAFPVEKPLSFLEAVTFVFAGMVFVSCNFNNTKQSP